MRKRKIRGHKRQLKNIERWRHDNISFDLMEHLQNYRDRTYAKIAVPAWNSISVTNSTIPYPNGATKAKILNGLLDIYESWKVQLEKSGLEYYLKLWLFEPRFSQSQVVCAIGENVDFYNDTFYEPPVQKKIDLMQFPSSVRARMEDFDWDPRLDEDMYENTTVGNPGSYSSPAEYEEMKNWFSKIMRREHRTYVLESPVENTTELYYFRKGNVWIGERKTYQR